MKLPIKNDEMIVFSDGFVWKILSLDVANKLFESNILELFTVRIDDESENLIKSLDEIKRSFECGYYVCIEVGSLYKSVES